MAKIIDFNKAKKRIVLKKSALQELREKMSPNGRILYFPREVRKLLNCLKCGGYVTAQTDENEDCGFLFRCVNCSWTGHPIKNCPHCSGWLIRAEGKRFCFHCLDNY